MAADRALKFSELGTVSSLQANDQFMVIRDAGANTANNFLISQGDLTNNFGANNLTANTGVVGSLTANGAFITYSTTPASSSTNVGGRRIWFDNDFLYVALSNTSIKRIPLEAF